jgi:predicted dehydrogenase
MTGSGKLTRRDFFRKAALGAASAVAAPYVLTSNALGAPGVQPASDRITLGILGAGGRAGNFYGYSPILAVCDVDRDRRQAAAKRIEGISGAAGIKDYNDFRDVLARPDIDAVIIAAPDHWHCQMSAMAALAGKDVYCEKPLSAYIKEGRLLSDLIAREGTVFQTGSQQRSDDLFRQACELVRNGYIGEVKKVTVGILPGKSMPAPGAPDPIPDGFDYDLWLGPAPWAPYYKQRCVYNFRFNLDYAAGKISDWGAHHLDIAQWGLGFERSGPIEVRGSGTFPTDGIFNCAIDFTFECKYPAKPLFPDGLTLHCSDKYRLGIEWQGAEGAVFVTRGAIETTPSSLRMLKLKPDDIHLHDSKDHWYNFIDCVKTRRQTAAPAEIAHRTVTICHAANVAMLLGRPVKWDPQTEQFPGDAQANSMPMLDRSRREPWSL